MNKINLAFLSFFSVQTCTAQSAIFDLFESNITNNKTEPMNTTSSSEDLTDQIVDSYTAQAVPKKPKINPRNQNTPLLSAQQIQQKQTADLIFAAQEANKAATQAILAADNLAAKIQLLTQAQESMQKASQNNCTTYLNESSNVIKPKAKQNTN